MFYVTLIADVVDSRKIEHRVAFNAGLKEALEALNTSQYVVSPYTLIGDEIQAVYSQTSGVFHHAFIILAAAYPQKIRFSYGFGPLRTPINSYTGTEMDGPAFYSARSGVELLKETKGVFYVSGRAKEDQGKIKIFKETAFINEFFLYFSKDLHKWPKSRLEIFYHYQEGMPVQEIAKKLSVKLQTVYKSISSARLKSLDRMFSWVSEWIDYQIGVR